MGECKECKHYLGAGYAGLRCVACGGDKHLFESLQNPQQVELLQKVQQLKTENAELRAKLAEEMEHTAKLFAENTVLRQALELATKRPRIYDGSNGVTLMLAIGEWKRVTQALAEWRA